jgi:hypothetical protein
MYFDFEAGNKAYKLRLTTKAVMALESKIGCNPMMIFGAGGNRIPTVTEMIHILHNSLTHFNHGITVNDAMNIFDAWLDEGHTPTDFIAVIVEVYKASGIIPNTQEAEDVAEDGEDNEKN